MYIFILVSTVASQLHDTRHCSKVKEVYYIMFYYSSLNFACKEADAFQ
jgi:hypothetical protein